MNTSELKSKLESLQQEEKELLNRHKDISLPTEEGIKNYIQENQVELTRLNEVSKEIRDIEWQLMSPEQQQELLDYNEKIKEKYSND